MKLNLGCGNDVMPKADGWINHDMVRHNNFVDIVFDLCEIPWLFGSCSVDFIRCKDVFEHIPVEKSIAFMNECWRILEQDGRIYLRVPEFGSYYHITDLTHHRGFGIDSFDMLDPDKYLGKNNNFYTDKLWKILRKEYTWDKNKFYNGRNIQFELQKRGQ